MIRIACVLSLVLAAAPACTPTPQVDPAEQAAQLKRNLANAKARVADERWKEAEGLVQAVQAVEPNNVEAFNLLAQVRLANKQLDEALALADKALAADGKNAEYHATRAAVLQAKEKFADAAASWGQAFSIAADNAMYGLHQGQALMKAKQFDKAEAAFRAVLEADEGIQYVLSELGDALREQGKLDEALTFYAKSLVKYQSDKMAYAGVARVYEAKGDVQKAIDSWSTYIRMDCCSAFSNEVAKKKIAELQAGSAKPG